MTSNAQLLDMLDQDEKARRRFRFENQTGAVHKRRNTKNRKAEAQRSNTKAGKAWRKEW
jgi:hypothetical protein